jgi:hypothetical protein
MQSNGTWSRGSFGSLRRRRGAAHACVKAMCLIARKCVGNGRVQNDTFEPNNSCGSTALCRASGWATAGGASAVCTAVLCRCKVCSQTRYTRDGGVERSRLTFFLASPVLAPDLEGEGSGDAVARGADTADFAGEAKSTSESDSDSDATCGTRSWSVRARHSEWTSHLIRARLGGDNHILRGHGHWAPMLFSAWTLLVVLVLWGP